METIPIPIKFDRVKVILAILMGASAQQSRFGGWCRVASCSAVVGCDVLGSCVHAQTTPKSVELISQLTKRLLPNIRRCKGARSPQIPIAIQLRHRSHFGSRYKSGCCGHASLLSARRLRSRASTHRSLPTCFIQGPTRKHGYTKRGEKRKVNKS